MNNPAVMAILPPRLSMDEYAEWVAQPCSAARLRLADRQKRIEEQILVRFRLSDEAAHAIRVHPCASVVRIRKT